MGYRVLWLACLLLFVFDDKVTGTNVCPETNPRVSTTNTEPVLVHVPDSVESISFKVYASNCSEHQSFYLNRPDAFIDENGVKWFQIDSGVKSDRLYVVVNDARCYNGDETGTTKCDWNAISYAFGSNVKVAKFCNGPTLSRDPLHLCETESEEEKFWREFQTLQDERQRETELTVPRYRHVRVIFIPIGAIIFFLSVCLRCCLYPRWKSSRRNGAIVTVVRRGEPVPSQDSTISTTPSRTTNSPPSYVDIENECPPPPPYSEVVSTNVGHSHEQHNASAPPDEPTAFEGNTTFDEGLPDRDRPTATTRSSLSRMLRAGPKSIKSQFSFKPMKEEE